MNYKVFYHANCVDGFGAAHATYQYLEAYRQEQDSVEYVPIGSGQITSLDDIDLLGLIDKGTHLFILDMSFPRDVMNYLFKTAAHTTWFDHHQAAFELFVPEMEVTEESRVEYETEDRWIVLDTRRSSALLTWQELFSEENTPYLYIAIDDHARARFLHPNTRAMNKAIWSEAPWTFELWNKWIDNEAAVTANFTRAGEALLREHDRHVQATAKKSRRIVLLNTAGAQCVGLAVNAAPDIASDCSRHLASRDGTFGVAYHIDHELRVKCTLGSAGDYDVREIAKAYGGVGQRNAAEFELDVREFLKLVGV